jgi:hypothetical protein
VAGFHGQGFLFGAHLTPDTSGLCSVPGQVWALHWSGDGECCLLLQELAWPWGEEVGQW